MIYGYPRREVNEYGLIELGEVTLAMSASELRLLGQILIEMAAEMDAGAFERCSHRHMTTAHAQWGILHPSADVIVMPPQDEQAGEA